MQLRRLGERETRLSEAVGRALPGLGDGDTRVVEAKIDSVLDTFDNPIWRVTLVLPKPAGDGWDVHSTLDLKLRARRMVDDIAAEHGIEGEGTTAVVLTTREAREADIALPDEPDSEEIARGGGG